MRAFSISVMVGMICAVASAQFTKGSSEVSFSGTAGTYKYESSVGTMGYNSTMSVSQTFVILSCTYAYYVVDDLAIEPQMALNVADDAKPGYSMIGCISYSTLAGSKNAPFVRIGYGIGTSHVFPIGNASFASPSVGGWDVTTVLVGIGIKHFVSEKAMLRIEGCYRSESDEQTRTMSSYKMTMTSKNIYTNLLIGFSILL